MRRGSNLVICCGLAVGLLVPLSGALAQGITGTIQGYITDTSGAVLPGVTVVVANTETGAARTLISTSEGFYTAKSLPTGKYSVTASLDGFQTARRENVVLLIAQIIDANLQLGIGEVEEIINVTGESPLVEVSRSSAASYIGEREIDALPIIGRDFTDFAFLTPTVTHDFVRGFVTMSGQRGIYTGLNIDGVSNKSAFFGYGQAGEATENDGLIVAMDSVREFQVVTSGFAPEYGNNGGGYINVVTQSGTNDLKGSAFYFFRDEGGAADLEQSPLNKSRGRTEDIEVDDFERTNWGVSVGGPIKQDRTHFYFAYDATSRDDPSQDTLTTVGVFDAVQLLDATTLPGIGLLVEGYVRNPDGTATKDFLTEIDNLILFGKLDHQFNDANTGTFRVNYSDYERISGLQSSESEKLEEVTTFVGQLVSVIGSNKVNEFRIQSLSEELTRSNSLVGQPIEAELRLRFGDRDDIGKDDFLPIFVEEDKLQIQDNFSYLFGDHDLKFGIDYQADDLAQLFAGSLDGRYDFTSLENLLNNVASQARIWFGDTTFPNYDEQQTILAIYAQDLWRVNDKLTVSYGFRYSETDNPDGLPHVFPQAREIPDDEHVAPRFGFTWSPGGEGRDVVRGGFGLFYGRTPSLLFASQVQQPGIFPFLGRLNVRPGEGGFVPLGTPIDNENPPADAGNSPAFVDPSFKDAESFRINLGYEREIKPNWSAGIDVVYAEGNDLQSNAELNRSISFDEFGRPIWSSTRPNPEFNEIFTRQSIGESEYKAVTLKINKRFSGRTQFQAHYTWSEDEDTDSNERSATGVTVSSYVPDPFGTSPGLTSADPMYDWGPAERDTENRFVFSGVVDLPAGFRISGIAEYRSGHPYDPTDSRFDFAACGFFSLGFNCPNARPVVNGTVLGRNAFTNESVSRVDVRASKLFDFGDRYEFEVFVEVFNLLDDQAFKLGFSFADDRQRDPSRETFGLGSDRIEDIGQRQIQIGARFRF